VTRGQNTVIKPFVRMGPLPRSLASEAHGCFMVWTSNGSNRIQGCGARFAHTGGLPPDRFHQTCLAIRRRIEERLTR
jgi:hypothetical protein